MKKNFCAMYLCLISINISAQNISYNEEFKVANSVWGGFDNDILANGNIVYCWDASNIYIQIIDPSTNFSKVGDQKLVNTIKDTHGWVSDPQILALKKGGFIVLWRFYTAGASGIMM